MNEATESTTLHDREVAPVTLLEESDRTLVDRIVFGDTPGYLVAGDPWSETLVRRLGQSVVVRDYLATFAATEEGARRVLALALGLTRMANRTGEVAASALSVAAWCAMSLGRWEVADGLAIRSQNAEPNALADIMRQGIASRWINEAMKAEFEIEASDVQSCSARTLRRLITPWPCLG